MLGIGVLPPCNGHIDKQGRKWPACPPTPSNLIFASPSNETKRRKFGNWIQTPCLVEVDDQLQEINQEIQRLKDRKATLLEEKKKIVSFLDDADDFQ